MLHDVSIERVDLRVHDVPRAEQFYRHILGGPPPMRLLGEGIRPERSPRPAAGLFHTAFRFPSRAALGAALLRLHDGGIRLSGASDHGVSEALYLDDPEGNGIELYWDRPREVWPEAMFSEPLPLDPLIELARDAVDTQVMDIGHVHYKAGDLGEVTRFWQEMGMQEMASILGQAAFLAADGYHHHVGANVWYSKGLPPQPHDLPGLDRVVIRAQGAEPGERREPCGTVVEIVV